jgi:5-methylcytosine-specific restriction endonuclease McrA
MSELKQARKRLGFYDLDVDDLEALDSCKDRVAAILSDNKWHSNAYILAETGASESLRRLRDLRSAGWVIEMRGKGRVWHYRWTGEIRKLERVTDEMQDAYYHTTHWRQISEQRRTFDCHECCRCKTDSQLEVHHFQYHLFEEEITDLMTLCTDCHKFVHNCTRVGFPQRVPDFVARRLRDQMSEDF